MTEALATAFYIFLAGMVFWVIRDIRRNLIKRQPLLGGFTALSKGELDARGWKSGLSGSTMAKLLSYSVGPADHLREVREWDRQRGRIEDCERTWI